MHIASSRFGELEIREEAVLEFEEGLIGLDGTRFALVAQDEQSPFYWLQSCEDAELALPVTNPWLFFPEYEARVSDEDAAKLGLEGPEAATIFCVVRAAEAVEEFTANLLAPIVVHAARRQGRQIINEAGGYRVREPLFAEVELDTVQPASPGVPVAAWAG
jgi:flagellar assembly factor FliW